MSAVDWRGIRRAFRIPLGWVGVKADVDAELDFHIQGRIDELMSRGMSREDAESETHRLFGDYARIESEVEGIDRKMIRRRSLAERAGTLWSDISYAARTLARQPMFAGVVIVTLTLGIGATSAIFHVVDRVVLHPLPYPEPERVVYLGWSWVGKGDYAGALSPRKFLFWHDQSHIFDGLAASGGIGGTLDGADGATVQGLRVTEDFFRVVRAQPIHGRAFSKDEFAADGPQVAILSYALWTTHFGADPRVIGRVLRLDDRAYTIIGIMPASFELAEASASPVQFLVPLRFTEEDLADTGNNYSVMGRLQPGVSESRSTQDMALVFARYRAAFPNLVEKSDVGARLFTYQSLFVGGDQERLLWILLAATLFVLLLACANVGNLMLARALSRQREFAVRTALGSGRARIVRQVVIEALLLGVASAAIASVVSLGAVRALTALAHGGLMRSTQLAVDQRALWFTTVIAVAASVGIGVAAAVPATRINLARSLAEGARGGSPSRRQRGLRNTLITTESAIAMVLLAGAGLLIASFAKLRAVDPGFARAGIVTASIVRAPAGYDSAAAVIEFERRVLERLRATPDIASAGATSSLPLVRGWNTVMTLDGNVEATEGGLEWRAIDAGYLPTFGIQLLRGRNFTDADTRAAPAVVIVSKSFADRWWPGEDPLGHRIRIGRYAGKAGRRAGPGDPVREIVGVVPDLKDLALDQSRPRHTVWVPQAQQVPPGRISLPAFAVRAPEARIAANALRSAIKDADPRIDVPEIATMSDIMESSASYQRRWFTLVLMALFAAIALGLTSVGIYGVVAYSVARRVHEIGVRMALGARPGNVIRLVVLQGMRPVVVGLVVGLAGSLALSRALAKMLFGVSPHDPRTLLAVAAVLTASALLASYLPARRATRGDPLAAPRAE